jgi:peptidoglycan/LPS O-acetylase OafA/YrhL
MIDQAKIYRGNYFVPFNMLMGLAFVCWLIQLQQKLSHYQPVWVKSASFSYTLYVTHFPLLLFILGCFPQSRAYGLGGAVLALISTMLVLVLLASLMAKLLEPQQRKALSRSMQ